MTRTLRYIVFVALPFIACSKGDKVPSYIYIPAVEVTTDALQGSASHNITDVWVYADDVLLGVWELPATVPALSEGPTRITVLPGIKRNGTFDDRLPYPFYSSWSGTVDLVRTGTTTISPTVTYLPNTQFWIEAFEDPGLAFFMSDAADTLQRFTPTQNPDIVLDNTPCGGFVLTQSNPHIRFYTDENFSATGGPTFLEVDYRSDITLTVGVMYVLDGFAQAEPYVYVAPSNRDNGAMVWKKIYIDLSPVFNIAISQRDIYFEANLPAGQGEGRVYLDNIKLVR